MKITAKVTDSNSVHSRLSVWVNGGLIVNPGGICLRNEEVEEFMDHLKISSIQIKEKLGSMMEEYRRAGEETENPMPTLDKRIALQVVLDWIEQTERKLNTKMDGFWEVQ